MTEAEAAFNEALKLDSGDTDCHYRLAQIYFSREAYDQALDELKLALLLKPDKKEYQELLGDIYMKTNRFDEALYQYKQVMEAGGLTSATVSGELRNKLEFVLNSLKNKAGHGQ